MSTAEYKFPEAALIEATLPDGSKATIDVLEAYDAAERFTREHGEDAWLSVWGDWVTVQLGSAQPLEAGQIRAFWESINSIATTLLDELKKNGETIACSLLCTAEPPTREASEP